MNAKDAKYNIIQTAQTLFLHSGIKTITMDRIAHEGHISKKTIYQYFKNKKHLIDCLFEEKETMLKRQIDQLQALSNPVTSMFLIYQAVFLESSVLSYLNDNSLKHCYPQQYETLTGMLFTLSLQTFKVQIEKGINQGVYNSEVKTHEFCFLLTNVLLSSFIQPVLRDQSFDSNLTAKEIIYYSLRSVVTPKGLKILQQTVTSIELLPISS